jgi:quinol monooxygenase YgiN
MLMTLYKRLSCFSLLISVVHGLHDSVERLGRQRVLLDTVSKVGPFESPKMTQLPGRTDSNGPPTPSILLAKLLLAHHRPAMALHACALMECPCGDHNGGRRVMVAPTLSTLVGQSHLGAISHSARHLQSSEPRINTPVMLADSTSDKIFCLNVKLCIKPERRDEFLKCIKNNQKGTLETEPLAIEYLVGEDTTVPNTFHFFEKYRGKAGFEAHKASPHFAVWEEFASSDPFTEPPRVEFYEEF